jgi:hypothetical protein
MKAAMRCTVQCRDGVVGMHSLPRSWRYPLAMLIKFGRAKWGANVGRRQATQGDTRRRSVQLADTTSDSERRLATVRLRLTSEGFVGSNPMRPPGQRVFGFLIPWAGSQRVTVAPTADASVRRCGHGEDAIYFAADKNR